MDNPTKQDTKYAQKHTTMFILNMKRMNYIDSSEMYFNDVLNYQL